MIGKLVGKVVGSVLASPAIAAKEAADAVDETGATISKAWDRFLDPEPKPKKRC